MTTTTTVAPTPFTDVVLDLPDRRVGKVRVSYELPDDERLFVTTDRLSAFDRIVAAVPYKGQVLNELAAWWFANTADIVANHVRGVPDPNVTIGVSAKPLPVEVIVRGHITGVTSTSLWKRYADGERTIYGYELPDGLQQHQRLDTPIITPTPRPRAAPTTKHSHAPRSSTRAWSTPSCGTASRRRRWPCSPAGRRSPPMPG